MDKALIFLSIISLLFLVAMMLTFSPSDVGPFGILGFFLLCYVLFLGLAVFGCRLFFILRERLDKTKAGNIKKKSYYYGLVIALAPILFLVSGSLSRVNIGLVVAVAAVEVLMCFLVSRNIL